MEWVLTETIGKVIGSLEEEISGTEVGSGGKAGLGGAVEVGWRQGAVLGIEAGNGDKAGLKEIEEGVAVVADYGTGPKMEGWWRECK